ncbi:MAG: GldG family protein [Treponema sp.]|nr:GldG family protein [Treponema sp.]
MINIKSFLNNRKVRYGSVSVIITITVILLVVLLNIVLTFLFNRFPLNIDLTGNRVFEISKETENFLSSLDKDIVIHIMNTEAGFTSASPQEYFIQANEVMRKFTQYSSHVKIEYVDLLRNPGFSSQYPSEQIRMNDIIVKSGEKYKIIYPSTLFNIFSSEYGDYVASSRAEQTLTSAMLNVISGGKHAAAVIAGHGAHDILGFLELLLLNNYELSEVNLLTGDIHQEVSLIILANPVRDLSPEELKKLDVFLDKGDNRALFYLASLVQPELPNIDIFLGEWGIQVDSGLVFETDNSRLISPSQFIAIADYAEDKYSRNMIQKNLQPLIAQSRPLRAVYDEFRYRYVTTLLKLSPLSGIRPVNSSNDWIPSLSDITGDIPALMLSTQARNDASGNLIKSHVLVCGSILALEESTLGNPYIANSAYFLDLLGALTGREDYFHIMDKVIGFTELRANYSQIIVMTVIFTVLLPLAVLTAGIIVWLRRRHK